MADEDNPGGVEPSSDENTIDTRDIVAHTPQPSFWENELDRISRAHAAGPEILRQSEEPLMGDPSESRLAKLGADFHEYLTGRRPDPEAEAMGPLLLTGALVGPHPNMPPRVLAALERAKAIAGDQSLKLSPGQRTEKAFEAGRTSGGWDQLPVRMGENGKPETEWTRYMPTFEPGKSVIQKGTFPAEDPYFRRNWRGKYPIDRASGTAGELLNLNPELLKLYPDLANMPMRLERGDSRAVRSGKVGGYRPPNWLLGEDIKVSGYDNPDIEEILSHELQHALDQRQGRESGANPNNEKRPWINKEAAFNRYESNIGEQNAQLNSLLDENKPYGYYPGHMPTFPSYELNPAHDPNARRGSAASKFWIERSPQGSSPREMPPSWQYGREVGNMRASPGPAFPMIWNAAKWGAITNAPFWLTHEYNKRQEADRNDEGKAFAPREPIPPPPKRSELGDLYGEDAKAKEDAAATDRLWGYGMLGANSGVGGLQLASRGLRRYLPFTAIGALGGLSQLADARHEDEQAARLRGAQRAWGNTGLPDRPTREGHVAGGSAPSAIKKNPPPENWGDGTLADQAWQYQDLPRPTKPDPRNVQDTTHDLMYKPSDVADVMKRNQSGPQFEYEGPQEERLDQTLGTIGRNNEVTGRGHFKHGGLIRMLLAEYTAHPNEHHSFIRDLGHGHSSQRTTSDRSR